MVRPRRRLAIVKDEPDNRVLECALTGRAEAIVTGDRQLFRVGEFPWCEIAYSARVPGGRQDVAIFRA